MSRRPSQTGSLFDFAQRRDTPAPAVPRLATARSNNPRTSHAAAREMNESGSAASLCRQIEEILGNDDHRASAPTPGELGERVNEANGVSFYDSVKVLKRLADLRKLGIAATFGERRCKVNKRSAGVWVLCASCCGNPSNHAAARLPDSDFETVQCVKCGKGLGVREVAK
jgi:hypothetical protein